MSKDEQSPTDDSVTVELTPDQIKNWRNMLLGIVGPYAMLMTVEQIQEHVNVMQDFLGE